MDLKNVFLVSFYTVSKVNVLCGPPDHRIGLSKAWSYANIIISTIAYSGGLYWISPDSSVLGYWEGTRWMGRVPRWQNVKLRMLYCGWLTFTIGTLLTIIFLHYDALCCCLSEEQVVIHDPSNPRANLVLRDRQVIT